MALLELSTKSSSCFLFFWRESSSSSSSWLMYIVLFLILLINLVFFKRERGRKRLIKHPPGPRILPRTICLSRVHFFGLPQLFLWQISQKYGPIMLLHLGRLTTLVISSAEIAKEILKTQDLNFCNRFQSVSTNRITYNSKDVAVGHYTEYWREMRKCYVIKLLSPKHVHSYKSLREEEVSIMINSIISASSTSPTVISLDQKLFSHTLNITFRILFGTSYQQRIKSGTCKFEQVISETTDLLGGLSAADIVPYIGWIIDVITGQHARLEKNFHVLDSFFEQFISDYLDPNRVKSVVNEAIIDTLFEIEGKEIGGVIITREHIKAVLLDMFIGSIDTTTSSMVWAMAELVKSPRIMKKVQDEVRSCVAKKGKVDESDLDQLEYLKMVVKETLRLHPPVPLLLARECIEECNIKGYNISRKTMVLVNVWAIGRDPESWGNPEVFIPERFMDRSTDFRGQNFEYLPFGAGRRGCPGISLGTVIMELTLANLLYSFNWELPDGMQKEDLNMEEAGAFALHKKSGLQVVPVVYDWQSTDEN